jgi:peptidyl-prolyl cis-trans isomerase SurA
MIRMAMEVNRIMAIACLCLLTAPGFSQKAGKATGTATAQRTASTGNAAAAQNDPVLMTVDGVPVTRGEFEAIYKKNNKDVQVTREALDEYLELFINYKLKVREAEVQGMDTVGKFRSELEGYRKQLARPYLIDRDLNEALMREAYERMQQEVRASHILVQLASDPTPEDTAAAWKRVMALRERVLKGEDFAAVARAPGGSDDPSAQKNGGDLGWFSALQMVYPFETAAYTTKEGELSQPVRTRFGYHIIKVAGKRPARGQVRVAHIMLRSTTEDRPEQQQQAEARIREIHQRIVQGEYTFADAAMRFSEDESSNTKGGELPMFGTGKMIDEFEDAAFALSENNAISEPVRTRYGWHIIKRIEHQAPATYDAAKAELKSKIGRDSRAEITRRAFLDKLKKEYGLTVEQKNLAAINPLVNKAIFQKGTTTNDTLLRKALKETTYVKNGVTYDRELVGMLHKGKLVSVRSRQYEELTQTMDDTVVVRSISQGWTYDRAKAAKLTKPVLIIRDRTYTQRDFLDYLEGKQRREREVEVKQLVDARFQEFVDESLLAYEDQNLENKYVDFRMLMKEYRDGILLFELTDRMVWGRAVKDSTGLEEFHAANNSRFMWDTRYDADIYTCANARVAKQVRDLLRKNVRGGEMMAVVNKNDPLALEIDNGLFTADQKPYLAKLSTPGLSADLPHDGRVVLVDLKKVLPPAPKAIDEARGAITAAYQDSLERAWLEELRARYTVQVNREVLYSIQ